MKLWVMVTVVVGVLAAVEEVGAVAKKRSRAHKKRHNRRLVSWNLFMRNVFSLTVDNMFLTLPLMFSVL